MKRCMKKREFNWFRVNVLWMKVVEGNLGDGVGDFGMDCLVGLKGGMEF